MARAMRRGIGGLIAVVGALVLICALVSLLWPLATGQAVPEAGALWFKLDPGSINLIQAVAERYVSHWLWQDVLFPVLLQPAWLVLAVLGLVVVLIGWLLRRRR
jgi:hypothetical protein